MTSRDRIVLMVVCVLAVLGAAWVLVVSPERKQASGLDAQVSAAKAQLAGAESQLNDARQAQSQYAAAYSSIVSLGKAVPAGQEVPSLIYELSQATHQQNVEFAAIQSASTAGSPPASSSAAAAAATASFSPLPFTFVFNGSFFSLEHLFRTLTGFTDRTSSNALQVKGRLLTIQSVKLEPQPEAAGGATKGKLSGTIAATAYELPAGQGLTAGATPGSPAASAAPTSSTSSSSATTAPAIARVTP